MMTSYVHLFPDELANLIEALRRDARCERNMAADNPQSAANHLRNARMSVRILEAYGYQEERHARVHRKDAEFP
jgi:hypothetical protein